MSVPELIRIVSRDSPMALAQVERVRAELAVLHPQVRTEVVPVKTTGDKWMGDLALVEGKGRSPRRWTRRCSPVTRISRCTV